MKRNNNEINKTASEIKNFFVKMRIIKDNYKYAQMTIFIFSIYFLVMGIVLTLENGKLFKFKHRIDDRCHEGKCEIDFKIHKN